MYICKCMCIYSCVYVFPFSFFFVSIIYIYIYICVDTYIFTILKWFSSFCLLLQCCFVSFSSHTRTSCFLGNYFNQFLLSKPIGMRCDERLIYELDDGLDWPPLPLRPPSVREGGALPRPLPAPPPPPLPRGPR